MTTSPRNARIKLEGNRGEIEIDGHPLPGVRSITLTGGVGEMPTLEVNLAMREVEVDGKVRVSLPEKTKTALLLLGWTPPEQTEAVANVATYLDALAAERPSDD